LRSDAVPTTTTPVIANADDRRDGPDRRRRMLHGLLYGSFHPRRRKPRRFDESGLSSLDWHHPWWLAIAVIIVLLSCIDAFLTLTLLEHGAYEVNPVMGALIGDSAFAFTVVKIGLTACGVVTLTLLARLRAFGRIPVGVILYLVLAGYGVLIAYELRLLEVTLLP
jgi:hypothetical protein